MEELETHIEGMALRLSSLAHKQHSERGHRLVWTATARSKGLKKVKEGTKKYEFLEENQGWLGSEQTHSYV